MIERINERLGRPERCPHGWPVEPEAEQAENAVLVSLGELGAGREAEIVRLAEHDGDLLHWFYEEGLVPGTRVSVRRGEPAAGELEVAVNGAERALSEKAADGIYVRAA
jgi:DtxR family Mn-dependent transcriptional regulator